MNGNIEDDYKVFRYTIDFDLTPVLNNVIDLVGKRQEKRAIEYLLQKLSGHQVEITKVISQAFPEMAKQMPRLFQKRVEDHRRSLRVAKVFSFRSSSSIEEEAVRLAWEDTRSMMREISMINNESVRGLVDNHREILRRLCDAMERLVLESPGNINVNFDELRKFLGGEEL